ncbi:MAG: diguanylate cyclase [Candidatus Thiodiazotropha sp. DIVDIV]
MSRGLLISGDDNPLQLPHLTIVDESSWRGLEAGYDADYFLVDTANIDQAIKIIGMVRHKLIPAVYLKPMVLISARGDLPKSLRDLADLVITPQQMNSELPSTHLDEIESVNRRINSLQDQKLKADTNLALRVVRYLYSRDREIEPTPSIHSRGGYSYPGIESLFGANDQSMWQTLEFLNSQHLVQTRFITRTHHCASCGCAFLNFKETCPQCQSEELESDDLVHHFRCGYTSELSDFKQQEKLVCPKCDRTLRHIGVDYDKPSVMYHCRSCDHRFQEPEIATTCYDCQRTAPPENQIHRNIEAYKLSMLGENAALFGIDSLFASILERKLQLLPLDLFERFISVEKARISRYKLSNSSLLLFDIKGLEEIYLKLGERTSEVFEELANLFYAMLRNSDLISSRNESLFLMLLTETSPEDAQIVEQRLTEGVAELLNASLGASPEIISNIVSIDASLDLTAYLEGFLNENHAE